MKKTALILAFLVCFIGSRGFAFGNKEKKPKPEANSAIEGDIKKIKDDINRINGEIKTIKENQSSGSGAGSADQRQGSNSSNQGTADRIPVTPKIVQFLLQKDGNYENLIFYLSKPFTLKILEQNDTAEIEIKNDMIIINPATPANEKIIEFPITSEGMLNSIPGPDKGRELHIFFQKQGKKLIFIRNAQQNCYELVNIEGIKDYKSNINELIQLYIYGQNNRNAEVQAVPVDYSYNNNQSQFQTSFINAQFNQSASTGSYNGNFTNASSAISSNKIIGKGKLTKDGVKTYVKMKNPTWEFIDIAVIDEYFKEAGGVNVDIAIAQMLYATNNLKRVSNNNYGGLKDGNFTNITVGVRAHIQHLSAYAHQPVPIQQRVDKRFDYAWKLGFPGITFGQVYPKWAPQNPGYGQSIENILSELYRF